MEAGRLLVTTDLSAEAVRPFDRVADLARSLGMGITLLHVVEDVFCAGPETPLPAPVPTPMAAPALAERLAKARELVRLEAERSLSKSGVPVATDVICANDVPRAIASYADEHRMDMIALSTHGRSGLRRMVMGSIAESVLRHAHVPVLVFPPPASSAAEGARKPSSS